MTDKKVLIAASFHRFVAVAEGKPERKEIYAAGQTVTVSQGEADEWIAKGLATAVDGGRFSKKPEPEPAAT